MTAGNLVLSHSKDNYPRTQQDQDGDTQSLSLSRRDGPGSLEGRVSGLESR